MFAQIRGSLALISHDRDRQAIVVDTLNAGRPAYMTRSATDLSTRIHDTTLGRLRPVALAWRGRPSETHATP